MSSTFAGRAIAVVLSLAALTFAFPSAAASPEVAAAQPALAKAQKATVALPPELRRVGPIAGPTPKSLAGFVAKPVKFDRPIASRAVAPVETAESRRQLLHLVDHRNLDRGPGSLVYMIGNVKPVAAVATSQIGFVQPVRYDRESRL
jgi:hypothetical protein